MLAWIFGDCREVKDPLLCSGVNGINQFLKGELVFFCTF